MLMINISGIFKHNFLEVNRFKERVTVKDLHYEILRVKINREYSITENVDFSCTCDEGM